MTSPDINSQHLGSAQQSDTHSTVTAVGGCVSASFVPTKPEPKVTTETWTDQVCNSPADGTATLTEYGRDTTISPVWSDESHSYVDGEPVVGDVYVISTTQVTDDDCEAAVIPPTTPPTTPPAANPTPVPAAAPIQPAPVSADVLAHTGSSMDVPLWVGGAVLLMLAGLAALGAHLAIRRRRAFAQVMDRLSQIK